MKLSARNVLKGKVIGIDKGQVTAIVRIDIGGGNVITSSVTLDAVNDLGLAKGSEVSAIIKASEVILGVPSPIGGAAQCRVRGADGASPFDHAIKVSSSASLGFT